MPNGDPRINQILQDLSVLDETKPTQRMNPKVAIAQDVISGIGSIFSGSDVPMEILARQRKQALEQEELDLERTRQQAFILREQLAGILDTQRTQADVEESQTRVAGMKSDQAYAPTKRRLDERAKEAEITRDETATKESAKRLEYLPKQFDLQKAESDANVEQSKAATAASEFDRIQQQAKFSEWLDGATDRIFQAEKGRELLELQIQNAQHEGERVRAELDAAKLDQQIESMRGTIVQELVKNGDYAQAFALKDRQINDYIRSRNKDPQQLTDVLEAVGKTDPQIIERSLLIDEPDERKRFIQQHSFNRWNIMKDIQTNDNPEGTTSPEAGAALMHYQDVDMDFGLKEKSTEGKGKFFTTTTSADTGESVTTITKGKEYLYLSEIRNGLTEDVINVMKQTGEWEDFVLEINEKLPSLDAKHVSRFLQGIDDRKLQRRGIKQDKAGRTHYYNSPDSWFSSGMTEP